jgi:hypothetical protein
VCVATNSADTRTELSGIIKRGFWNFFYSGVYLIFAFLILSLKTTFSVRSHYLNFISLSLSVYIRIYSVHLNRNAVKSLARPPNRCILFNGENIYFDLSLVIYTNSTNIPPIMIINRIYETQNLLSL